MDSGIDNISHEGFKELHGRRYSNKCSISCSYLFQPPTSKSNLFIWLQDDKPVQAFDCTYDFTQTSFLRSNGGSITAQSAAYAYKLYENAVTRSIFCNHSEVEEYIIIRSSTTSPSSTDAKFHDNCVHLPLITRTGEPRERRNV